MKNQFKKMICLLCLTPLLMSAANPSGSYIRSDICESNVLISELLSKGKSEANCLSNVKQDIAAKIQLDYELYEMPLSTVLFTKYIPVYSLIYKIHVYLNSDVKYKGGVGNWFDGDNPTYLNNIVINANFYGVSNLSESSNQYPSSNGDLFVLQGKAINNDYPSDLNRLRTTQYGYQTSCGFISNSYSQSISELPYITSATYDQRIAALIFSSCTKSVSTISFQNTFKYGYELYNTGTSYKYKDYNNKYSGPTRKAESFNFAFFGAMNYESDTRPTSSNITLSMQTTHGSTTWLDSFTTSASIKLNF